MRLIYVNDDALDILKKAAFDNVELYKHPNPWLQEFFGGDQFRLMSSVVVAAERLELLPPDANGFNDAENCERLFTCLRDLKPVQAADERLWVHLCHEECWDYMRLRWPVERNEDTPEKTIIARYFFLKDRSRAVGRNGLSRLWWYAWMTREEGKSDPFELTRVLLRRHDDAQNLLERTYPHNREILQAILRALRDRLYYNREAFRSLVKSLNRIGGVNVLDSLTPDEVHALVSRKLDEIEARLAVPA